MGRLKLEQSPGLNSLNIYRLARLILDLPLDHAVMPLISQRFFTLFLGRGTTHAKYAVFFFMFKINGGCNFQKKSLYKICKQKKT